MSRAPFTYLATLHLLLHFHMQKLNFYTVTLSADCHKDFKRMVTLKLL